MLRPLHPLDLPQILLIEQAVHVIPWAEDTFKTCLTPGYVGWVIELEQKVIAFMIAALYQDECHILNLCVSHAYQRQGWGCKLLIHTLDYASLHGAKIIYLEVRRSNTRAISLYKKMRFHLVGERKNYYPIDTGHEDALIFAKSLRLGNPGI